jgi:hypothetical protein
MKPPIRISQDGRSLDTSISTPRYRIASHSFVCYQMRRKRRYSYQVRCLRLSHCPRYVALSYMWGSPASPQHTIRVDGQKFCVRDNLWHALQAIREAMNGDTFIGPPSGTGNPGMPLFLPILGC